MDGDSEAQYLSKAALVSFVASHSFRRSGIRSVIIPKTVRVIESKAFMKARKLEEVVFEPGSSIVSIGPGYFAKCDSLSRVLFHDVRSLRTFSEELFMLSNLASICVPNSVRTIGVRCFDKCHYLSSVTFGKESQLKRICKQAFHSSGLVSFEAPSSLVALGKEVFYSCHELTSVVFSSESSLRFIGHGCFRTSRDQLARVELPGTVCLFKKDAFDISCFVTIRSNDARVTRALGAWHLKGRNKSFKNPNFDGSKFLRGALALCEDGVIGRGGQGSVKVKQNMITGQILAVKTVNFGTLISEERWEKLKHREMALQKLHCPCLVRLRCFHFEDIRHRMTIGMDYVTGPCLESDASLSGDSANRKSRSVNLKTVLEQPPPWWTMMAKVITMLGVAHGIDYLHGNGFIHRDLRPSNILFDQNMHPKICDFDIARNEDEDDSSANKTLNIGTHLYMAPEVSSGDYGAKADFYSFGCILYEMFEGSEAFRQRSRHFVTSNTYAFTNRTAPEMQKVIESCLSADQDYRCSFLDNEDSPSLLAVLSNVVRTKEFLNAQELEVVEGYLGSLDWKYA